jgi:hypothetical protein
MMIHNLRLALKLGSVYEVTFHMGHNCIRLCRRDTKGPF